MPALRGLPALSAILGLGISLGIGLALSAAPAGARPLDEVTASGVLRVAVYGDNAPFSDEGAAKDPAQDPAKVGRPRGIDVDIAQAIADRLKVRLDLRVIDAGENVDGDFRLNLWRGDLAGTPLADLLLHVPNDRMLAVRNEQVFLTTPYFDQHLAFAYRRGKVDELVGLDDIGEHAVAVEGASASDIMMLTSGAGRYRGNLRHYKTFEEAARGFLAGEAPILAGTRAGIEAALAAAGAPKDENPVVEFQSQGVVKTRWELGAAVRTDSRDLAYAVGDAFTALRDDGRLKAICAAYGVTYTAPAGY